MGATQTTMSGVGTGANLGTILANALTNPNIKVDDDVNEEIKIGPEQDIYIQVTFKHGKSSLKDHYSYILDKNISNEERSILSDGMNNDVLTAGFDASKLFQNIHDEPQKFNLSGNFDIDCDLVREGRKGRE